MRLFYSRTNIFSTLFSLCHLWDNAVGPWYKTDTSAREWHDNIIFTSTQLNSTQRSYVSWAIYNIDQLTSCQMRKIACRACAGNAGNVFPTTAVSDLDMHHGTCVTHVLWCMPVSLTSGLLWSRWRGKRYRYSRRMRNAQFYVSGKRPIATWISNPLRFNCYIATVNMWFRSLCLTPTG